MKPTSKKYTFAVIATDVVIFTMKDGQLQVLLIKMKKQPFTEFWAAPGGLVSPVESINYAASRVLAEKTGVSDVYLEQLYTFGEVDRDPFGRVVSVAYFALIQSPHVKLKTTAEYGDVAWFPVKKLPKLAYDHAQIIRTAIQRLKAKLEYTNIVYSLLPKEFTLSELQQVYQTILDEALDKRNFRKKVLSLGLLKKLQKKRQGTASRPAELYSFISTKPQEIHLI